jgi:hypothetical protein
MNSLDAGLEWPEIKLQSFLEFYQVHKSQEINYGDGSELSYAAK